jgi:hypothetical protein
VLKACCFLLLSYFVNYEFKSARAKGLAAYFSEFWNFFDYMLFILFVASAVLSMTAA